MMENVPMPENPEQPVPPIEPPDDDDGYDKAIDDTLLPLYLLLVLLASQAVQSF
jgi:hypothetical protein